MIAKHEPYGDRDSGYRISGGRLYLDDFLVPVDAIALRNALSAHYDKTGEDLERTDRSISREFAEGIFEMDRERTLPILGAKLFLYNQLREQHNRAPGFVVRRAS